MEPGINKPFDRLAKEFADEAPLLFLRILGIVPPDVAVQLEQLRPETAPPISLPDYVAVLSIQGLKSRMLHIEFLLQYRGTVPATMARYGGSLAWQYRMPVTSILLLLKNEGVPADIPEVGEFAIEETRLRHPFRTVRLWELDPQPMLETADPSLLPWALLMRFGREEAERLGAEIGRSGNERGITSFLTLGSLRYPRKELERMIGGPTMSLEEAIIEGSWIFQEARERAAADGLQKGIQKGLDEGLQQGLQRGQAQEARRLLTLYLADRFPGLETMPELDRIAAPAVFETLLIHHVTRSDDRTSVEAAIKQAARETGGAESQSFPI